MTTTDTTIRLPIVTMTTTPTLYLSFSSCCSPSLSMSDEEETMTSYAGIVGVASVVVGEVSKGTGE